MTASTITAGLLLPAFAQQGGPASAERLVNGRRKLGQLEVSSVGLGCQDMTGTFYATAPRRPDMIALARAALDRGVTFFDAAEAYGPLEVERIVGEAVAPFRNRVAISSKFGWNIDPETGRMVGGLNSRPEHIRAAVDGMLKRLADGPDRSALPAPRRSGGPDRRRRRHGQGSDRARKGVAFRSFRTRSRNAPPRARGAAGNGCSERILDDGARPRGRHSADMRRTGNRLRVLESAGHGIPDGGHRPGDAVSSGATSGRACPGSRPKTVRRIWRLSRSSRNGRAAREQRLLRLRWPG